MDKVRHVSDEYFASDKIDEKVSKLMLDLRVSLVYRTLATQTEQLFVNRNSPTFDCLNHMWAEFVIGSLTCSERFLSEYSGFPL